MRLVVNYLHSLLLAVVAVGVGAAAVAVVDGAGGGHVQGAEVVVARALAVELAGAEVDVRGAVAVHPRLGLKAVGAGIAGVEGDGLEDGEHAGQVKKGSQHQASSSEDST